jgi:hypothetical protein
MYTVPETAEKVQMSGNFTFTSGTIHSLRENIFTSPQCSNFFQILPITLLAHNFHTVTGKCSICRGDKVLAVNFSILHVAVVQWLGLQPQIHMVMEGRKTGGRRTRHLLIFLGKFPKGGGEIYAWKIPAG